MNINELKGNKKNRNLVLYLRKVVESYRSGFVSSKELKTDLYMDFRCICENLRFILATVRFTFHFFFPLI